MRQTAFSGGIPPTGLSQESLGGAKVFVSEHRLNGCGLGLATVRFFAGGEPFTHQSGIGGGEVALACMSGACLANTMAGAVGASASVAGMDGGDPHMVRMVRTLPPGAEA
ncbi:MAG: hypothetical protein OEV08_07955 [Nitrospira sp.]|jgi:hypothetical protein|nr:hypothetical protein [Nitrospira sp.]